MDLTDAPLKTGGFSFPPGVVLVAAIDGSNIASALAKPRPGQKPDNEPNVPAVEKLEQDLQARGFETAVFWDSPFLGFLRATFPNHFALIEQKEDAGLWFRSPRGVEADAQILSLADQEHGVVVSNDAFDAEADQYPWVKTEPWRLIRVAPLPGGRYSLAQADQKSKQEQKKRELRGGVVTGERVPARPVSAPLGPAVTAAAPVPVPAVLKPAAPTPVPATPARRHIPLPVLFQEIKKDSRASVVSSGTLPWFMDRIYIEDDVDRDVEKWLKDSKSRLLVLTGSAGHGKSAAIARAKAVASRLSIPLRIRYDATHAEKADQSYRTAMREFLAPFAESKAPPTKHLLAMNLGLALDFFGDAEDLSRFQSVARSFEDKFALGLRTTGPPHPNVEIIDLRARMKLSFDGPKRRASVPFIEQLLAQFALDGKSPAADAARVECAECPKQGFCPVLMNARLLTDANLRRHLAHAIMAGAIEGGLHLTPRNLLDVIARVTIPPELASFIDTDSPECSLRTDGGPVMAQGEDEASSWGKRLHLTLFDLAFPSAEEIGGEDLQILLSLSVEDPAQVRSETWDKDIMKWMADPRELHKALPPILVSYLGIKDAKFLGLKGLPLAIRSVGWTGERAIAEESLMDDFIALCTGNAEIQDVWTKKIKDAITRIASHRFDDQPLGDATKLALNLEGVASKVKILADLIIGQVHLETATARVALNDAHFRVVVTSSVASQGSEQFDIDWERFRLLDQVARGYQPPSTPGPHQNFLAEVSRRLAGSSTMGGSLVAQLLGGEGEEAEPVRLTVSKTAGRLRVKAEVAHAGS